METIVMRYIRGIFLLLTFTATGFTESNVFLDTFFPYRVVCAPVWVEREKNDSLFILQDSSPGKKTQMQLRRYPIDSGVISEPMNWSRLNFMVNRELASGVGRILWEDSGSTIKLGELRAFELFALYSQKVGNNTVWWAEFCRWTERNNYGYLAVIMGDTSDLKLDLGGTASIYQSMMDSIDIMDFSTTVVAPSRHSSPVVIRKTQALTTGFDLLGRKEPPHKLHRSALLLRKGEKTLLLREMHSP
jgi:hypothetical protein